MKKLLGMILAATLLLSMLTCVGMAEDYIVIGNIQDISASSSAWGLSYKAGAEYAVEEINANGGVNGKLVKVITYDCASDVTEGINAYNRLCDEDGAVAVMGLISNVGLALTSISEEKQVPMVTDFMDERCTTNEETGEVYPYMFLTEPSCNQQAELMAGYAIDVLGATSVAMLYDQSNAYCAAHAEPFKEFCEARGVEVVANEAFNTTDNDYRAQMSKIIAADPDVLFISGYTQANARAYQQARLMGYEKPIVGNNSFCTPFASLVGENVYGVYYPNNVNYDDENVKALVQRYEEENDGVSPSYHVFFGYDNVKIICDAIERAGTTDGPELAKALEETKDVDCLTGSISIDPETHRPLGLGMWIYEVDGTEYVPLQYFEPEALS